MQSTKTKTTSSLFLKTEFGLQGEAVSHDNLVLRIEPGHDRYLGAILDAQRDPAKLEQVVSQPDKYKRTIIDVLHRASRHKKAIRGKLCADSRSAEHAMSQQQVGVCYHGPTFDHAALLVNARADPGHATGGL